MGYSTDFWGKFKFNKPLDDATYNLLYWMNRTRRMARNVDEEKYGIEGEFYTESREDFGQKNEPNVINTNEPPRTQPGLWMQWRPTEDRMHLEWDEGEKFYHYTEWLIYLIQRILAPRGYILNGEVEWQGEDSDDYGKIEIKNNKVLLHAGVREYAPHPDVAYDPKSDKTDIDSVDKLAKAIDALFPETGSQD